MKRDQRLVRVGAVQAVASQISQTDDPLPTLMSAVEEAADRGAQLVVTPECGYPAYFLGSADGYRRCALRRLRSPADLLAELSRLASRLAIHLVFGFVEESGDRLYNAAALFSPAGALLGVHRKQVLWHFDHGWFTKGQQWSVFQTDLGPVGMVICADARAPETIATLAGKGARLIAMPTAWVTSGAEPSHFRNHQVDFMISLRAREHGLCLVCASKVGVEADAVTYCGRSCVVDRLGRVCAQAGPDQPEVVVADVELTAPAPVAMGSSYHRILTAPGNPRNAWPTHTVAGPVTLAAVPRVVAEQHVQTGTGEALFRQLQAMGVAALAIDVDYEPVADRIEQLATAFDLEAVAWPRDVGVREVAGVPAACLPRQALTRFAPARALALAGALLLFVLDAPEEETLLRTRATENRLWLIAVGKEFAALVSPEGQVVSRTQRHRPSMIVTSVDPALAANKLVAPLTDIFSERIPETYYWR